MPRRPRPPRAPKVASGQAYGQRQAQEATLASVPSLRPSAPAQGGGGVGPGRGGSVDPAATRPPSDPLAAATQFQPPALTPLDAPTDRPSEAVTTGLPIGAGAGPEALGSAATDLELIRAAYRQYPSEALREMIEDMETAGA